MPKGKKEVTSKKAAGRPTVIEKAGMRRLAVIANREDRLHIGREKITSRVEAGNASNGPEQEIGNLPKVIHFPQGNSLTEKTLVDPQKEKENDRKEITETEFRKKSNNLRKKPEWRFSSGDHPQSVEDWLGQLETTMNRLIHSIAEELCPDFTLSTMSNEQNAGESDVEN